MTYSFSDDAFYGKEQSMQSVSVGEERMNARLLCLAVK